MSIQPYLQESLIREKIKTSEYAEYSDDEKANESQEYTSAGTSIKGKLSPSIKYLVDKGYLNPGMKVLDYGAGKYARNSIPLREMGIDVFSYDPFNGFDGVNGWSEGVSKTLPKDEKFDAGFTAYVLNVVPEDVEAHIVKELKSFVDGKTYHATRNKDIIKMVNDTLNGPKNNKYILDSFIKFANESQLEELQRGGVSNDTIYAFTSSGFTSGIDKYQRVPDNDIMSSLGFSLIRNVGNWKLFGER